MIGLVARNLRETPLITVTDAGLYCEAGGFFIDPWRPVDRAIITHSHSDHARRGHGRYLTPTTGEHVLRTRLDPDATIDTVPYGAALAMNGVQVSLHPAGHILGSAQVRVEHAGEVWVVSGDYKLAADATCQPFEPVPCHTFVTECTFGLPIYRWPPQHEVFEEINDWWRRNRESGQVSVVFAYALGKAQRILGGIDASIGPILCHGAVQRVNEEYRRSGIALPPTAHAGVGSHGRDWDGALVLAPPSAMGSPWLRRFGGAPTAFASGWMRVRGARRRRSVDRGFVLSDHADWPGLSDAIRLTGASRVLTTHGYTVPMVRWLRDNGIAAEALQTEFVGERDDLEIEAQAGADTSDESEVVQP
jgi:putative mRNA 3-end processing factor